MIAGFSFQGTEMVGVAAGESKDPQNHSSRNQADLLANPAVLYIVCIFIIGTLVAYNDPRLLQAAATEDVALSPFTLLYEKQVLLCSQYDECSNSDCDSFCG